MWFCSSCWENVSFHLSSWWKVLDMLPKFARDVAMATNFWTWRQKLHKIGHIFHCVHNIFKLFASMLGFPGQTISNVTNIVKGGLPWQPNLGISQPNCTKSTITLVSCTISLKFLFPMWGYGGHHLKSTREIGSNVVIYQIPWPTEATECSNIGKVWHGHIIGSLLHAIYGQTG